MVRDDGTRGALLGALAAKRNATEDEFVAFEDGEQPGNYLLVPYATRFNSPRRVSQARRRFDAAWNVAGDCYDRGVVVTLTTGPSRFDFIADATESLMTDVNRFKSWLANRFGDGNRPPSVVVPEFTESGLPHVHVAAFSLGYIPHHVLSHYWDARRDRGSVVWCDGIVARSKRWLWADERPDRADGRSPRQYLGKTLVDLAALAVKPPEQIHDAAGRLRRGAYDDDDSAPRVVETCLLLGNGDPAVHRLSDAEAGRCRCNRRQ